MLKDQETGLARSGAEEFSVWGWRYPQTSKAGTPKGTFRSRWLRRWRSSVRFHSNGFDNECSVFRRRFAALLQHEVIGSKIVTFEGDGQCCL